MTVRQRPADRQQSQQAEWDEEHCQTVTHGSDTLSERSVDVSTATAKVNRGGGILRPSDDERGAMDIIILSVAGREAPPTENRHSAKTETNRRDSQ